METRQNLVARIRFGTEPGKKESKQATGALLCDVFKVKVIVGHQGKSTITIRLDDGQTH
jgi:hypothetical protein